MFREPKKLYDHDGENIKSYWVLDRPVLLALLLPVEVTERAIAAEALLVIFWPLGEISLTVGAL